MSDAQSCWDYSRLRKTVWWHSIWLRLTREDEGLTRLTRRDWPPASGDAPAARGRADVLLECGGPGAVFLERSRVPRTGPEREAALSGADGHRRPADHTPVDLAR